MILLRGRGHGHILGVCREGAAEMAAKGYNFIDILQFYYTRYHHNRYSSSNQEPGNVKVKEDICEDLVFSDA